MGPNPYIPFVDHRNFNFYRAPKSPPAFQGAQKAPERHRASTMHNQCVGRLFEMAQMGVSKIGVRCLGGSL